MSGLFNAQRLGSCFSSVAIQRLTRRLVAAGFAVAFAVSSQAGTFVWDGGVDDDSYWKTDANWAGDVAPDPVSALFFAGSTDTITTNDFDANTVFSNIQFNAGAGSFELDGNAIKLSGNITNNSDQAQYIDLPLVLNSANRTIDTAAGDILINGNISQSQTNLGLIKSGIYTLTLGGSNNFSGTTRIMEGTVVATHSNALGTTASVFRGPKLVGGIADTIIATGAALQVQGNIEIGPENITLNGTGLSDSGVIRNMFGNNSIAGGIGLRSDVRINTVNGTLLFSGIVSNDWKAANFTLIKDGTGTLALAGANVVSNFTLNAGALNIRNNSSLGGAAQYGYTSLVVPDGASLELEGAVAMGARPLYLTGMGVDGRGALRNVNSNASYAGKITLNSDSRISSDAGQLLLDVASGVAITGENFNVFFGGAGNILVNDPIRIGTGALVVDGSSTGMVSFASANLLSGGLIISNGVVRVGNLGFLGPLPYENNKVTFGADTATGRLQLNGVSPTTLVELKTDAGYPGMAIVENGHGTTKATLIMSNEVDQIYAGILRNGGVAALEIRKKNTGRFYLLGTNDYTGDTLVDKGQVVLGNEFAAKRSALSPLCANAVAFLGGTNFTVGGLTGTAGYEIGLTNQAGQAVTLTLGRDVGNLSFSGKLTGPGGIVKVGKNTQALLSSGNSYEGNTTVKEGELNIGAHFLSPKSSLYVEEGAKIRLSFYHENVVSNLYLNGVRQPPGLYNHSNTPEYIENNPVTGIRWTGNGAIRVLGNGDLMCKIDVERGVEPGQDLLFKAILWGANTNISIWHWDINGSSYSSSVVTQQISDDTAFTVTLTVTNTADMGASDVLTRTIRVAPRCLSVKSFYTEEDAATDGFTLGYDAFTNWEDCVASGNFVPYWSTGVVHIVVPSNYPSVEAGIAAGNTWDPYHGTNIQTTVFIYANTAEHSNGQYSNSLPKISGSWRPWIPNAGMIIKGVPRTNVVLRGGFNAGYNRCQDQANGYVLDGLVVVEGAYSTAVNYPRYITVPEAIAEENIITVRNCYFPRMTAGDAMRIDINATLPQSSFLIESNYFDDCTEIELPYGSNCVVRGNLFYKMKLGNLYRHINPVIENNTFLDGCLLDFAGSGATFLTASPHMSNVAYVIHNNFIDHRLAMGPILESPFANDPNDPNGNLWDNFVVIAISNYWGSPNGPYDPINPKLNEPTGFEIETDENSTDSANYLHHVNEVTNYPGGFDVGLYFGNINFPGYYGTTNIIYVPWLTNVIINNEYTTEEADEVPREVWVGKNFTESGPNGSVFFGEKYMWMVNAFSNIQQAVDRLDKGGVAWLAPETFEISTQIVVSAPVMIIGTQDVTMVSAAPGFDTRLFWLNDIDARLNKVVLSNGYAKGEGWDGCGGAVLLTRCPSDSDMPTYDMATCVVVNCRADVFGGGVAIIEDVYPQSGRGGYLRDTRITGCVATKDGGGVFTSNNVYMLNCVVDNCQSLEGRGGGVCMDGETGPSGGNPAVHYYNQRNIYNQFTVVSNCTAKLDGGGAYFNKRTWYIDRSMRSYEPDYWLDWCIDHIVPNWTFVDNRSLTGSGGGAYADMPSLGVDYPGNDGGLYFYGCTFLRNQAANMGGGLYSETGRIDTCTFINNAATNQGGGLYLDGLQYLKGYADVTNEYGQNPWPWLFWGNRGQGMPEGMPWKHHWAGALTRCSFDGNVSYNGGGGGIFVAGTNYDYRTSTWGISNLVNNVAYNGNGGGIAMSDSTNVRLRLQFLGGTVDERIIGLQSASNNMADFKGGALYVSNAILSNCTFEVNTAADGGALYLMKSRLERSTVSGNTATNQGGGVYLADGALMRSTLVQKNSAGTSGGGVYMVGATTTNENNTIVLNAAPAGSGVTMEDGRVRNAIVWLNTPATETWSVSAGSVEYTCEQQGIGGSGNIASYPRFMNAGNKDFRLAIGSPCVDAGLEDNQSKWNASDLDLSGAARNQGATLDMGAYEGEAGAGPQGAVFIVR